MKEIVLVKDRRMVYYILVFLVIINLAIILNLPILRQIFGFIYLSLFPGALILLLLKHRHYEVTDFVLLSIGLSLAFVIIAGLSVDILLPLLSINRPLTLYYALAWIDGLILLMLVIMTVYESNANIIIMIEEIKQSSLIAIPIAFPFMALLGVHILKNFNNNYIIYILIILIICSILFVALNCREYPDWINIHILFLISLSLLILVFFRAKYVYASDAVIEYKFFNEVLNLGHWSPLRNAYGPLGSCLSVTIFPTINSVIIDLPPSILFKSIYLLPFSLTPIITYKLARGLLSAKYSFMSSIFLISQSAFLYQVSAFRTYLCIFFFSLAILALLNSRMDNVYKRSFFLIFIFSAIVSHYSNTVMVFIILFILFIILTVEQLITSLYNINLINFLGNNRYISMNFIILFFIFIFLWYAQMTENAFGDILGFLFGSFEHLGQMFIIDSRAPELYAALGGTLGNSEAPMTTYIKFINSWASVLFIVVGMVTSFLYILNIFNFKIRKMLIQDLILYRTGEVSIIILLSLICLFLFGFGFIAPYIFQAYSLGRTYYQITVFLSIFFTIGGVIVANFFKISANKRHIFVLLILIIYFANSLDIMYQFEGYPVSRIVNSPKYINDFFYIYDSEELSIKWIEKYININESFFYADKFGCWRLTQIALIPSNSTNYEIWTQNRSLIEPGYIYLRSDNIVKEIVQNDFIDDFSISLFQNIFNNRGLIYCNGGSSVLW